MRVTLRADWRKNCYETWHILGKLWKQPVNWPCKWCWSSVWLSWNFICLLEANPVLVGSLAMHGKYFELSLELRIPIRSTREGLRPLTALMCWPVQNPWVVSESAILDDTCTVYSMWLLMCTMYGYVQYICWQRYSCSLLWQVRLEEGIKDITNLVLRRKRLCG